MSKPFAFVLIIIGVGVVVVLYLINPEWLQDLQVHYPTLRLIATLLGFVVMGVGVLGFFLKKTPDEVNATGSAEATNNGVNVTNNSAGGDMNINSGNSETNIKLNAGRNIVIGDTHTHETHNYGSDNK